MRNYMKKSKVEISTESISADELIAKFSKHKALLSKKTIMLSCAILIMALCAFAAKIHFSDPSDEHTISLAFSPMSATAAKRDYISIPSGTVKANPFVPYRNIDSGDGLSDVPKFDLVAPPEVLYEGSEAARVMDTIVSGILYDKLSPSAILNIEGNDYLVKKGDVVNNYKVVNIEPNSVTVKLGGNTFKAGIGEILTEGSVNHNDVSNLSKKFGGEKR